MKKFNISKIIKTSIKKFSEDYYKILGINQSSSKTEIKKSFIKLAKEHHPDKNPNSKEKFKKITEAYQTLTNPEKKKTYDSTKSASKSTNYDDFQNFWQTHNNENFEDIYTDFQDFFNFTKTSKKSKKGSDIRLEIRITFLESLKGTKKAITYTVNKKCSTCKGLKHKPNSPLTKCPLCRGKGTKLKRQGPMQFHISCEDCLGQGKINKSPCLICKGSGEELFNKKESVDIPKGVENNQFLRVRGRGDRGVNGGEDGDLMVRVLVEESGVFRREGLDLFSDCWISLRESVFGAEREVRGVEGAFFVEVKRGTCEGDCARVEGKGVERGGEFGDHWVVFRVRVPRKEDLSRKEVRMFEELRSLDFKRKEMLRKKKEDREKNDFYGYTIEKEVEPSV